MYRLWSKGIALEWAATLQRDYLGQAALGFRAQAGTLHVAQLLSDIIALQCMTPTPGGPSLELCSGQGWPNRLWSPLRPTTMASGGASAMGRRRGSPGKQPTA